LLPSLLPPLAKPLLHQVDASSAVMVMSSWLLMPSLCSQDNPWFLAVIFNLLDWMVRFHWINVPSWSVLLGPVSAPQEIFLIHQPMHQFLHPPQHQFLHPPQHQFLTQPMRQLLSLVVKSLLVAALSAEMTVPSQTLVRFSRSQVNPKFLVVTLRMLDWPARFH
jgi:hypothetical protein